MKFENSIPVISIQRAGVIAGIFATKMKIDSQNHRIVIRYRAILYYIVCEFLLSKAIESWRPQNAMARWWIRYAEKFKDNINSI